MLKLRVTAEMILIKCNKKFLIDVYRSAIAISART